MPQATASDLVADIEQRVRSGTLSPGDRLGSVRSVAAELGVAPNTIASAYRQLRERGIVIGRGRQGTIIADRRPAASPSSAPLPAGIVDARSGNPNPALQPDFAAAVSMAAKAGPVGYGDRMVTAELGVAGRRWLASDGIDAANLTLASGAMDAIERVLVEHVRRGDRIGIEDPGHAPVHDLIAALGLEPVLLPIDEEGVTPAGLEAALTRGVRAIIVTPRAQNPTGSAFTPARVAELDALLRPHRSVLVVEDDHAGPIAGVPLAGLDRDRPKWAVVRSVSKSLGPDLRLALLAGDRNTVDRVEDRVSIGPGWVSHLLQRTVAFLLDDPETATVIEHAAERYAAGRTRLIDALEVGGVKASGRSGLHVWIPVAAEQPVAEIVRSAGYAIRLGSPYRRSAPPAVRITVAGLEDHQLDAIAQAVIAAVPPRTATTRLS